MVLSSRKGLFRLERYAMEVIGMFCSLSAELARTRRPELLEAAARLRQGSEHGASRPVMRDTMKTFRRIIAPLRRPLPDAPVVDGDAMPRPASSESSPSIAA